jgi:hypothetical protein
VLEAAHRALRRRVIWATCGDRRGDPRAQLLDSETWVGVQPRLLEALGLPADPDEHLNELGVTLDAAWRQVADGLGSNPAVEITAGKLRPHRLGPAPEPPGTAAVRAIVRAVLPRVDFPELLLEVVEITGMAGEFTHIAGSMPRMDDLDVRCAS